MKADNEAHFKAGGPTPAAVDDDGQAEGRSSAMFALAFVVMIYGVVPWEDLGIAHPHARGGGSPR